MAFQDQTPFPTLPLGGELAVRVGKPEAIYTRYSPNLCSVYVRSLSEDRYGINAVFQEFFAFCSFSLIFYRVIDGDFCFTLGYRAMTLKPGVGRKSPTLLTVFHRKLTLMMAELKDGRTMMMAVKTVMTTVNAPHSEKLDAVALAHCLQDASAAKGKPGHMSSFFGEVPPEDQKEFAAAFDISASTLSNAAKKFASYSGETYQPIE